MEHIADHLRRGLTTPLRPESPEPLPNASEPVQAEAVMDRLWLRMSRIYGHRWTANFGAADDGTWAKGLRGLSGQQIALGLSRCVSGADPWPPTLPEFRALCTPSAEDLGLPGLDAAYREAANADRDHAWSHPAVYVATQAVGLFELRTLTQDKSRPLFERAYEIACRRVIAGETLTAPIPVGLQKLPTPAKPETVSGALAAMREALHGGVS